MSVAGVRYVAWWDHQRAQATASSVLSNLTNVPMGSAGSGGVSFDELGFVRVDVGCLPDLDADTLDSAFGSPIGPLIGWDNPHVYPLGDNTWLWLVHDSYFDFTGQAADLHHDGPQIQNLAFVQVDKCFRLLFRGSTADRRNFEPGELSEPPPNRFLWPLGGERHGDTLWVFWSEMVLSDPPPSPGNGIVRHPERIWLASYNADTLERLSFEPAPNDGVFPSYGFAVASDESYSYLFGNSNLLNYESEGGYLGGPHSATRMYLARVPLGQFDTDPSYWTGDGWSALPSDAAVISDRFFAENTMQPRYIDGQWVAVTKENGFSGRDIVIDMADHPWGPWRTVRTLEYTTREAIVEKNSYQPIILPWSSRATGLDIVISENAVEWGDAVRDPALYRPGVIRFEWPLD